MAKYPPRVYTSEGFWDTLPLSWKYGELSEKRHAAIIRAAIGCRETGVLRVSGDSFILYGPDEGLLVQPESFFLGVGLEILAAFGGL